MNLGGGSMGCRGGCGARAEQVWSERLGGCLCMDDIHGSGGGEGGRSEGRGGGSERGSDRVVEEGRFFGRDVL